jgi:hypothetical protein
VPVGVAEIESGHSGFGKSWASHTDPWNGATMGPRLSKLQSRTRLFDASPHGRGRGCEWEKMMAERRSMMARRKLRDDMLMACDDVGGRTIGNVRSETCVVLRRKTFSQDMARGTTLVA